MLKDADKTIKGNELVSEKKLSSVDFIVFVVLVFVSVCVAGGSIPPTSTSFPNCDQDLTKITQEVGSSCKTETNRILLLKALSTLCRRVYLLCCLPKLLTGDSRSNSPGNTLGNPLGHARQVPTHSLQDQLLYTHRTVFLETSF